MVFPPRRSTGKPAAFRASATLMRCRDMLGVEHEVHVYQRRMQPVVAFAGGKGVREPARISTMRSCRCSFGVGTFGGGIRVVPTSVGLRRLKKLALPFFSLGLNASARTLALPSVLPANALPPLQKSSASSASNRSIEPRRIPRLAREPARRARKS